MVTQFQQSNCPVAYTWHTRESASESCNPSSHSKRGIASGFSKCSQKQKSEFPIEINYPGTGNNSQFVFDPNGRNVKIVEVAGGSTTSTKQFIWSGTGRGEERDASGSVTKRFFSRGQTISGTSYLYTQDHLGSIREMVASSGNIQAQYSFDPFGQSNKVQGSLASDYQFAGYYFHQRSSLALTRTRAYSCSFGRFLSRDIIGEGTEPNIYGYVGNDPVGSVDPSGLQGEQAIPDPRIKAAVIIIAVCICWLKDHPPVIPSISWPSSSGPHVSFKSPDELIQDPATKPHPVKPRTKSGRQFCRPGGKAGADKDFNDLGPTNVQPIQTPYGQGQKGELPGGGSVSVRPGNSQNATEPTIQIDLPGEQIKIRYP